MLYDAKRINTIKRHHAQLLLYKTGPVKSIIATKVQLICSHIAAKVHLPVPIGSHPLSKYMQKRDQTKSKSGIETTPDYGMNMDFLVQMDIIFIEDRPWHLPTTNGPEPTEEEFSRVGIK